MLSKKDIQVIRSLDAKKYRQKYHNYLAEGEKICLEILRTAPGEILTIYALAGFLQRHKDLIESSGVQFISIDENELRKISHLKTPNQVLAVLRLPDKEGRGFPSPVKRVLYLDNVRDPGNLGTILRSAEWFGMDLVILSPECVDPFNPKVVQSAMGSLHRVPFTIQKLNEFLVSASEDFNIYFAEMSGSNAFHTHFHLPMVLVMGNESHGINLNLGHHKVSSIAIPGTGARTESLNVAIAASILMAQIFKH